MPSDVPPAALVETARPPTVSDQVFEALYRQVVTLELPPGTRLSEVEVAQAAGVSRQPVRDAFWRLSQLGLPDRPAAAGDDGQRRSPSGR